MNLRYSLRLTWELPRILGIALFLAPSAHAVQFEFGTLIRAGFTSAASSNWEVGVGTPASPSTDTSSLNTYWNNNEDRRFEIEYLKSSNTVNLRVYSDATNTSAFTEVSYNPVNGSLAAASATWTLPASAFFVTATTGPTRATSIQVSNLTLAGVSGAVTILQPIQQTTLSASRAVGGLASTASQSQNIVFLADSTGSWRLSGDLRLTGIQFGGRATGNQLAFGFSASANDAVPEPDTLALGLMGLAMLGLGGYRTRKGAA